MCMAFPHVPMAEFMMMSENADKIEPNFGQAFRNEPLPKDGYITLSDAPGWGLTFDKAAMNLIRPSAALRVETFNLLEQTETWNRPIEV